MCKRFIAMFIAILMVLSISACSPKGETTNKPTHETVSTTEPSKSEQQTETVAPENEATEDTTPWFDTSDIVATHETVSADSPMNDFFLIKNYKTFWSDLRCLVMPQYGKQTVGEYTLAEPLNNYIELTWDQLKDIPLGEISGMLVYGDNKLPINGMLIMYSVDSDLTKSIADVAENGEFICSIGFDVSHEMAEFFFGEGVYANAKEAILEKCGMPSNVSSKITEENNQIELAYRFDDCTINITIIGTDKEQQITIIYTPNLNSPIDSEG